MGRKYMCGEKGVVRRWRDRGKGGRKCMCGEKGGAGGARRPGGICVVRCGVVCGVWCVVWWGVRNGGPGEQVW